MSHIVLFGSLSVGFHAVGPFESYGEAADYGDKHAAPGFWFVFQEFAPSDMDAMADFQDGLPVNYDLFAYDTFEASACSKSA